MLHHEHCAEGDDTANHLIHAIIGHNELRNVFLYCVVKHSRLKFIGAPAKNHAECDQLIDVHLDLTKSALLLLVCLALTHLVQHHFVSDQSGHARPISIFVIHVVAVSSRGRSIQTNERQVLLEKRSVLESKPKLLECHELGSMNETLDISFENVDS